MGAAEVRACAARSASTTICHENPDGDTLGAATAIACRRAARQGGRGRERRSATALPRRSCPGSSASAARPELEPDVAVVVDAGELSRIGSVAPTQADGSRGHGS